MLTTTAQAQTVLNSQVVVNEARVQKDSQDLKISFELDLTNIDIKNNNFHLLIPVLRTPQKVQELPSIELVGRRRYIYNLRNEQQTARINKLETILRNNNTAQNFSYSVSIPYEEWMNSATLEMSEEACGCLNTALATTTEEIEHLDLIPVLYPRFVWYISVTEEIKVRDEVRSAYINYPSNKVGIYSYYLNNREELNTIKAITDIVSSDNNVTITGITIKGYTSPEGSSAVNTRIAKSRAEYFKQYIKQLYSFLDNIFTVDYDSENWGGLKKLVEASNMGYRDEILKVIDSNLSPDNKKLKLILIDGGVSYNYMLKNLFPMLRKMDYKIDYTVRSFNIEETKIILKEDPKLLNLYEVYSIAQTYEVNTTEFNEIIKIALQLFPEAPEANLNAANLAMIEKDYDTAAACLAKSGNSPESIHSKGVLEMMNQNYQLAKDFFEAAQALGVDEATHNLIELEKIAP